jgi:SagB-type dehydrogenase family enzyme
LTWREYHELTKHTAEALRRDPHALDWVNMPDPFRHYEGAPVLDLPAISDVEAMPPIADGAVFLSRLLFDSAAISATKQAPSGTRYALRVNPSSGNLHPTEFHFITRGLSGWPDGLYHYRPSSHMAEQRAAGCFQLPGISAQVIFVLTSIVWREAWKYRERAYRYCLLDIGHAAESLAIAARALGFSTIAHADFLDDAVSQTCRFNGDEWPMLILELHGCGVPVSESIGCEPVWQGGTANQLSAETVSYPLIEAIHEATKRTYKGALAFDVAEYGTIQLPAPVPLPRAMSEVARTRRSALDFLGGRQSISQPELAALLDAADVSGWLQLYLYVHRVESLDPGVYRFWPRRRQLEPIQLGDQRVAAAGLSLGQDLAGNACVAFSMVADLERATSACGDRGYRYVHFEAGAIGHRLYLAAEALRLGATGIGAFYDDEVHRYLDIAADQGQVVYHFAVGYPVLDPRLGL